MKAYKKKASAFAHMLKFSEAVEAIKAGLALDRNDQSMKK